MSTPVVLLVEDSADDVEFAARALARSGVDHELVVAQEGAQALQLVTANDGESFRPDLVLLDLNLPGLSGHEVLARLKSNPATSALPVVILSTSSEPKEIDACLRAHANSYHAKPTDFVRYQALVRRIASYWLEDTNLAESRNLRKQMSDAIRSEPPTVAG